VGRDDNDYVMRKSLVFAIMLGRAAVCGSDDFSVGDIKVKCDCDKDEDKWQSEQIDPEWTKKLGMHPPNININAERRQKSVE
jgi:hypothetical protein